MQIAQLLIQAKYHRHFKDIIQLLGDLFPQLPYSPGLNYQQAFIINLYGGYPEKRMMCYRLFKK